MSNLRAVSLALLASATLLGCKPEQEEEQPPAPIAVDDAAETFARQICANVYACSCDTTSIFESEAHCVEQLSDNFQISIDSILANGGTWNDACAGQLAATWTDWACLGQDSARREASFDARVCPVVKGSLGAGVECSRTSLGDDCAEGLSCVSGVCVEVTVPVAIGGVCELDWDELPCASGSFCDYDVTSETQICKPLPKPGDACDPNFNYVCGPSSLDLVCDAETSTCGSGPGVDEPCFQGFLCGPGHYCDGGKEFTCQEQFELGDGCGANAVCPIDSSCVSNICTADAPFACELVYFSF